MEMDTPPRHGLARVLSRMGVCSRAEAMRRIAAGRVRINGRVARDAELPTDPRRARIELDGVLLRAPEKRYVALHKPRGLVVSTSDERGRDTVYACLRDAALPWLAPVGRLDKASEGLLLLSNDSAWAARVTDPAHGVQKVYRVQVRGRVAPAGLQRLCAGIVDRGELLQARSAVAIGGGERNTWLEIALSEGRNRELRRMLGALGHDVLRLLRIAVGPVVLGDLSRGEWRLLTATEVSALLGQ
jgi:23S rRNA pseudouridine2605 synthase